MKIRMIELLVVGIVLCFMVTMSSCSSRGVEIEGSWESVGSYGFGQAQPGEIVTFDGSRVNLYSPFDSYELIEDSDGITLKLDTFGDETVFDVYVIDNDNIELDYDGYITELQRIE